MQPENSVPTLQLFRLALLQREYTYKHTVLVI